MKPHVAMVALLVRDYDAAIAWYRDALGFALLEDTDRGGGKRWVRMAPAGNAAFSVLLARAATPEQQAAVGNQHGGRVGFFLHTDDFARDHARLSDAGAVFEEAPRHEEYGTVAVFRDLYGNRWDLIQPASQDGFQTAAPRATRSPPACGPHRNVREGRRMTRIVVASGNAGKLAEFQELLGDAGIDFVAQGELGVEDIEETGLSFVENALLKARHAARATGLPALADDSGLCVGALGGAPGLYSARYAGGHGDAQANIDKLLDALREVPDERRGAHFHAAIVLLRHAEDPQPLIAEGSWHGRILHARRGDGGFGYDPVFLDPERGRTAAELDPALKNRISHRGQALATLRERLALL